MLFAAPHNAWTAKLQINSRIEMNSFIRFVRLHQKEFVFFIKFLYFWVSLTKNIINLSNYFKRFLNKKLLSVIHVKAPVPLLHGWPIIKQLDGEVRLSNWLLTIADFKNFSVDSNDICCNGDADDSMPDRLSGLNDPSNVI